MTELRQRRFPRVSVGIVYGLGESVRQPHRTVKFALPFSRIRLRAMRHALDRVPVGRIVRRRRPHQVRVFRRYGTTARDTRPDSRNVWAAPESFSLYIRNFQHWKSLPGLTTSILTAITECRRTPSQEETA